MTRFQTLLDTNPVILADGGMGTMLFDAGLESGASPQVWNSTHPDRVRAVHRCYLDAGSRIILSNTFGGNRFRLARHGLEDRVVELNRAGAALVNEEVKKSGTAALAAGDIGPTGELLAPLGKLAFTDAVDAFADQARALLDGGIDLIWIETMSALQEVQAAVEGVRRVSQEIPIVSTMTFEKHGRTMMGVAPAQAMTSLIGWGVCALGGNCGTGPQELLGVIRILHDLRPAVPLVFKPNAGVPQLVGDRTVYDATPERMAHAAVEAACAGARVIGACCGSTPAHIRAMAAALAAPPEGQG